MRHALHLSHPQKPAQLLEGAPEIIQRHRIKSHSGVPNEGIGCQHGGPRSRYPVIGSESGGELVGRTRAACEYGVRCASFRRSGSEDHVRSKYGRDPDPGKYEVSPLWRCWPILIVDSRYPTLHILPCRGAKLHLRYRISFDAWGRGIADLTATPQIDHAGAFY